MPALRLRVVLTRAAASLALLAASVAVASAQRPTPSAQRSSLDTARFMRAPNWARAMRWRLVGPFRGGRAVAVAGDPKNRNTYWFGSVDGGVWKSTSGGNAWTNVTDGKSDIASVGAIAVAPSDPSVVYVGGGEADLREDWTYGDGIWRTTDAGDTWTHLGLADARQIARIVVDPQNPDRVWVAAMGHASGPNDTRGVYRTTDGGKHWDRVLFLDDSTGAIDLAIDPTNPRILYAAMWRMQRQPWGFIAGADRSGLFKSTDGGDTWTEITHNPGMPKSSMIGRIGIAVSPANPQRVYAMVECPPEDSTGGVFRSDDAGASWTRVNGDQKWMVRPWYFSLITADPKDENTLYSMNLSTWKSIDAGKTWSRIRVPHGDTHVLWVDPNDPQRMMSGNDGGASVSLDGGATWSTEDNQPTAQFYHVTTDDQFPYRIYGAQQDNTTVSIASRSDDGAIGVRDWYWVGGGESGYIAPKPGDPNIVVAGTYTGTLTRYDVRTQQRKDISVGLNNYDGWPAAQVPNRFQWTFPIFYSKHEPGTLYVAANRVFRSTNDGDSWEVVSPDLTRHDPKTMGPVGGPVTLDATGTEWYATIFALAESPVSGDVLWAGSDDGLIHVSRDRGKTWTNVTPRDMASFTRVSIIEPSHFDAGTAYVAANRYQLDDFRPMLWKTTDFGRTWTRLESNLPDGAYTRAIREDTERRGLLFAGTETGIWFSTNDGAAWQPLQLNLPRASVRDLHIHGADLIAATHGRAFWVLDDIAPLRQLAASGQSTALLRPEPAVRFAGGRRFTRSEGENPPSGAVIDYWIANGTTGTAKLEFADSTGKVIRTFESEAAHKPKPAFADRDSLGRLVPREVRDTAARQPRGTRMLDDDTLAFAPSDSVVTMRAGLNRVVWDLRYPGTHEPEGVINDEGTTSGPMVVPGSYTVRLTVGGKTYAQPLTVRADPRHRSTPAGYAAQLALALAVQSKTNEVVDAAKRIVNMESQLDARSDEVKGAAYESRVTAAAKSLHDKVEALRDSLIEIHSHADEITLHYPVRYYNMLLSLADMVQSDEGSVTAQESTVFRDLSARADALLAELRRLESTDLASFNALMREVNAPAVSLPAPTAAAQVP